MNAIIHQVVIDSIADQLGLVPGDAMLALNGNTSMEDMLDYQFEVSGSEYLELHIKHVDGSEEIYEIEKDPEDDLGIVFESPIFTAIKTCNNACPFCFIDQQPQGLRSSLYVKDDDYRLSYFNNTYITLTNLTPHDRARMERLKPGPLYVSVHCTVPEIREQLLQNTKHAGKIMENLQWLKSTGIPFHCQVVVCPGINDGEALTQTINDLYTLAPEAMSVAVVPVGLTQYRDHLTGLTAVTPETAGAVIDRVEAFQNEFDKSFVYLSDEFYLKAGRPFPLYDAYGDFPQLDDGVGTARMLLQEFFDNEDRLPQKLSTEKKFVLLTGKLGAMILSPIINRLNGIDNLYVDLVTVINHFWGDSVDIAGLITGQDLIATLNQQDVSQYTAAIIPSVMLKHDSETFLDDKTIADVEAATGIKLRVVDDSYSASDLLNELDVNLSATAV